MTQITLTKKTDKAAFNAVEFCEKARVRKWNGENWKGVQCLEVKRNRLAATDGHRLHYTPVKGIPSGLYEYSKVKSTITLIPVKWKFPDINIVIPKTFKHKVKVNREELLHLAKNAMIIANERYRAMIMTFNGRLEIEARNPDLGTMKGEIKVNRPVEPEISIGVNPQYVIDTLKSFERKTVTIGINATEKPLVFKDTVHTGLVMPMRF